MAQLPRVLREDADPGTLARDEVKALWRSLTGKQQSWLQQYLTNGLDATKAVYDSEYQTSDPKSASQIGYENRNHEKMRMLIEHACRRHMSENEALQRLSSLGRVTFADFISFDEDTGKPQVDLQKARDRGVMHHIKSIKWDTRQVGEHEEETYVKDLKLHDPVKPNTKILKALGAFDHGGDEDAVENVTFNQWITKIEDHTSGRADDSPWPEVEGEPEQFPDHQRQPSDEQ